VSVRVSFNLDDADLEHLATLAQQTQLRARSEPADAIVAGAREVLETANRAQLAGFVKERYSHLDTMLQMVGDSQWELSAEDRQRVLNALACFGSSSSAASPSVLLDHAIMIELVSRDLHHDLDAYRDFCKARESYDEKKLQERRTLLQERMHKRRRRDLDGAASGLRKLLTLLGL
jgi:hypothetical protein